MKIGIPNKINRGDFEAALRGEDLFEISVPIAKLESPEKDSAVIRASYKTPTSLKAEKFYTWIFEDWEIKEDEVLLKFSCPEDLIQESNPDSEPGDYAHCSELHIHISNRKDYSKIFVLELFQSSCGWRESAGCIYDQ